MKLNSEMLSQLSEIRSNLISWYPFKEEDTILEISYLNEGIAHSILKHVTFAKNIYDIPNTNSFDYILLEGVLENSQTIYGINPEQLIETVKKYLKEDGTLLIATDNKLGIYNLCSEQVETKTKYLGKKALEKILDNQGFTNRKFYYPLPNYLIPNVIYTDTHLPDIETINRNVTFYDENTLLVLNEIERYRKIIDEDKEEFKKYSNSFLIECKQTEIEDNNIEFIAFSNLRKKQYRIKTVIQGNKVYKYSVDKESNNHIENIKRNINIMNKYNINTLDSYETDRIVSDYKKNIKTFDRVIIKELKQGNIEDAIQIIKKFKIEIENKLEQISSENTVFDRYNIKYTENDVKNFHFVKYGLWDLIFKNCFFIDNKFYFYDQEWMEENIPIEFILYRALEYFDGINKYISKDELYKKIGIGEREKQLFKELDDIFQKQIRDEKMWNLHLVSEKQKNVEKKIEQLNHEKEQILEDCRKLLNEKDARISNLEEGMEEALGEIHKKEETINSIINSKSWKITEPLRKLKSKK